MDREKATSIRIPPDLQKIIRQLAKEHQRSVSGEVAWALRLYVAQQPSQEPQQERGEKIKE